MTIAAAPSEPVSINTLILLSLKRAGVVPVEARLSGANMVARLEHGRQLLDLIIDGLAVEGFMARTTLFYDLPIVAGENTYTLPDNILDVFEDAMFVPSENLDTNLTTGELVCSQVDMTTWQLNTTKGSVSSRPQQYCAFRQGAQVQLKFWPVPSEAGTMRLKTVRLLGSNADGRDQPDLARYWFDCLVWLLAWYVATDSSMPSDKVSLLGSVAEAKKRACIRYSMEHPSTQAVLSYSTQWSP